MMERPVEAPKCRDMRGNASLTRALLLWSSAAAAGWVATVDEVSEGAIPSTGKKTSVGRARTFVLVST